jgi:hypothetical protein
MLEDAVVEDGVVEFDTFVPKITSDAQAVSEAAQLSKKVSPRESAQATTAVGHAFLSCVHTDGHRRRDSDSPSKHF